MLIDAKLFLLNGACPHREVVKFNNFKSEVRLLSSAFCKFFLYVRFVCKGNNKKFLLIKRASLANGVLQSVQGKTALTDRLCCKGNYSAAILMTGSIWLSHFCSKWHLIWWNPRRSRIGGNSVSHKLLGTLCLCKQRVWNGHPDGGFMADGISPSNIIRFFLTFVSATGTAESKASV